jgi:hypothetical protein
MSLQNRATPNGDIVFSSARGTLMGNRGCLHDGAQTLGGRRWTTRSWVICLLSFGGRRRELMRPGYYTELFFLDEATALAAGHRPCAECQRDAWRRFASCWAVVSGLDPRSVRAADLDRSLHVARVDRRRGKVTYQARFGDLPDGAMVVAGEGTLLKWQGTARPWSLEGYGPAVALAAESEVTVLTPRPIVDILRIGYTPSVHATAARQVIEKSRNPGG